jgi:glycosyltransferase involved in cell wall biosynthesis
MSGAEWFGDRPGGLNRYFQDLFLALSGRDDCQVEGYAFGTPPEGGASWGPTGGHLTTRVRSSRRGPAVEGAVLDRHFAPYGPGARRAGVDVVHFQGPWAAESAVAGQRGAGVALKRAIERRRYRGADAAVVLSAPFRDILCRDYGFPADRVHVIPPGVDLARFTPAPERPGAATVVCVRRLERRMGIDVLLDAWVDVVRERPGADLVVVGQGAEEGRLRTRARELGIDGSVRFAGRVTDEELRRTYADAACSVVPTLALEGFGLIALESLAVGRAPVVTRVGGLPDSVTGLDPSLVVEPGSASALAERLTRALAGDVPDADACRRHAALFDWSVIAQRHVDLYRGLGA